MIIEVTEKDIRLGKKEKGRRCVTHCAVARAVRRYFPKHTVVVGLRFLHINDKTITLPMFVSNKIRAIYGTRKIKPFTFRLKEQENL